MFTKRCCQLIKIGQQSFATGTRTLLMLLLLSSFLLPAGSFGQIAPFAGGSFTPAPTNGFNIDGSLRRLNTSYGDWLMGIGAGLNTPGTFVLSDAGTPLYPLTFHVVDPQNSDLDDAFDGGEKVFHDPNTWAWTTKKQLGKDDINNSLIHIAQDPAGDYWAMLAGDRRTTEGTSYIDFEFLQNTLTKDADGGFTSAGPNGGRTIGDILITVEYTNGGIVANILYYRWQSVGEGTFDYVQFTPPNTQAFGSVNQVPIPVPYGAFGSNTYDALQFVEVAINFSQLIRGSLGLDPCQALSFKTLFIKTKSSDARTADLKDLIEPIQINLNLGVQNISYAGPFCDGPGSASPTIDNPNNLPAGTFSGSAGLVINSTTGVIDLGATPPGTYTVTYTYQPRPNCIRQATTQVVINPPATANAGADQTVCASSPAVTLAGSVGGSATSGTWSGGTGTFNPNATTLNATYTPSAAEIAAGTVTLTLTTNDPAGPCGSANDAMTITINPAATANAGADQSVCATSPNVTLAGSVGGGATSGTWSGGTGTFNPNATTLNAVYTPSAAEIAAGTVTLTLTTNNPDGPCNAATDQMTITISPAATANAGADQTICAGLTVQLAGSVGGSATSGTWSGGTGTFNPNASTLNAVYTPSAAEIAAGSVTLTLTTNDPAGACGTATDQVTITITPCGGDTYCTYTQGQYGTEGGMACIGDALLSTYDLINHALDNLPGDQLYIGKPGRSFLISRNADNINAVIGFLPGGGKSVILSGNILATAVPGTMLKNGALNNTLLAQTITLGLNLGVKSNLASFELESGQWLVTQGNADCSEESEVVPCDYDSVKFAANVVTFLQNHVLDINNEFVPDLSLDKEATVLELFHLASNMLGGRTYAGITLDNVAKIADDINNIFDGCRTSLGYTDTPPHCPELIITESGIESAAERITTPGNERGRLDAGTLQVTVNPNPIRTSLNIRIKSPVSGNASVEVFNAMGQKIYQTNRYVVANVLTTVTYGDVTKDGMLLYRVRVGKHSATGKAIKP